MMATTTSTASVPTQVEIDRYFPNGHRLHTARVEGPCQFGQRPDGSGPCSNRIRPGDRYLDGYADLRVGPWSRDRWCMECVFASIAAGGK